MIDHLSFGVAHIDRSRAFYDNTLGALGYKRLHSDDGSLGYGTTEPVLC
ncbi:MAG TPA: VOC family protein, partial [Burkholderia sp.]|nr:VOC family protein [Burkholderia sp.]